MGHEVVGVVREKNSDLITDILYPMRAIIGDVSDADTSYNIVAGERPDYIFNMAAKSSVGQSFDNAASYFTTNTIGCLNILEAIRHERLTCKFLQASTSEMYGDNSSGDFDPWFEIHNSYQDEETPFHPKSPYGVSKLAAHYLIDIYRKLYGINCSSAICFNHESPFRPENFVTRKITKYVAELFHWANSHHIFSPYNYIITHHDHLRLKTSLFPKLRLGNIKVSRDWGHAQDYANAMILIMQSEKLDDYVICTGENHTLEEFISIAFKHIGIDNYMDYIIIDESLYRPLDITYSNGDNTKLKTKLGWEPKITFGQMATGMVDSDIFGPIIW
jgi:GDPmannose 4,6-dehydratase